MPSKKSSGSTRTKLDLSKSPSVISKTGGRARRQSGKSLSPLKSQTGEQLRKGLPYQSTPKRSNVPRPTNIMEKPSKKSSPLAGRVPKESKGPHQLEFSGTASVRKKQQGTPKAKDVTVTPGPSVSRKSSKNSFEKSPSRERRSSSRSAPHRQSRRLSYNLRSSMFSINAGDAEASARTSSGSRRSSLQSISPRKRRMSRSFHQTPGGTLLNTPFQREGAREAIRKVAIVNKSAAVDSSVTSLQKSTWEQDISVWFKKQWRVCSLSSLANFDILTPRLQKAYQSTLRSKTQGAVDYISINVSYSIPKEWDDINADKRSPGKKPTTTYEKKRVLYQGMVLSNSFISHSREPEYSLYMYNGLNNIHLVVVDWLQDSFGALVSLNRLPSLALIWGLAVFCKQLCGVDNAKKDGSVELRYRLDSLSSDGWQNHRIYPVPPALASKAPDVSYVGVSLPAHQMRKIAFCVVSEDASESVTHSARDLLYCLVQQLMADTTALPQEAFRLTKLKTNCVSLTTSGQVQISCKRHLVGVLQWLMEVQNDERLMEQINIEAEEDQFGEEEDIYGD